MKQRPEKFVRASYQAVLRLHGTPEFREQVLSAFGRDACSWHGAGERVGSEFSFAGLKAWPTHVVVVTPPSPILESDIADQLDWITDILVENSSLLQTLIQKGAKIDISTWCHTALNVGDFRVSKSQMEVFAQYGISIFFRFMCDEAFQ
jgi:hypothetical protein